MIAETNLEAAPLSSLPSEAKSEDVIETQESNTTETTFLDAQDVLKLRKGAFGCPCQPGKIFNSYQV